MYRWDPLLKVSFGKSDAHSLTAYMPLLVPHYVPGGLIGVMEPIHHMNSMNMAVLSCNVRPRLFSSWPIMCGSSGCYVKDITGNTFVGVSFYSCRLTEHISPAAFACASHAGPNQTGQART